MLAASPDRFSRQVFFGFGILLLASIAAAVYWQQYLFFLFPAALLFGTLTLVDYPKIYHLLLIVLPVSFEFDITRSLSISLPAEPIMILLFLVLVVLWVKDRSLIDRSFLTHPVVLLLLLHLLWILVSQLYTVNHIVSIKFFLAKLWFVGVGLFLSAVLIKSRSDFKKVFWSIFIPLILAVTVILIRHAIDSFRFDAVNYAVMPIFKNHVNYAALLTIILPWAWMVRHWYPKGSSGRQWITFGMLLLMAGIIFSYTRAAWVVVISLILAYYLIRWGWLKWAAIGALLFALGAIYYFSEDNRYLDYAPDYATTIYHEELDEHLEATVQLQDVSTAERIYRWVAAFHMFKERPLTGFGPNNFYPYYKKYTVLSFRTYVSENEERSTVHNYYLLMLVEQGLIGCVLFLLLVFAVLVTGESIYHKTRTVEQKQYVMGLLLSVIAVLIHILVSDLIEVDKIGVPFFMAIALLVNQHIANSSLELASKD